jgi:hypothetical protein
MRILSACSLAKAASSVFLIALTLLALSPELGEAACCMPYWCTEVDFYHCMSAGGQWALGPCNPNPCPLTVGACCTPGGPCQMLTRNGCDFLGVWYIGDNVPCSSNPCELGGACCFADGSCAHVMWSGQCQNAEGVLHPGVNCTPNPSESLCHLGCRDTG